MLSVTNVNIYYGRKRVIHDLNFTIQPGEIVGLIGPNGAGKTTIMKTLLGLTRASGEVTLAGEAVTPSHHAALQKVGALIEAPAIYPFLTGKENLALYAQDPAACDSLVQRLGMTSYIDRPAKDYSVGMKQKLGIALALLDQPQLVILDEPMNGLDIEATILVRKLIHDYARRGTAFLISSHVLSELQKIMTKVLILNHGTLIVNAPVATFNPATSARSRLAVTAPEQARQLLEGAGLLLCVEAGGLVVETAKLAQVEELLLAHQVTITALGPAEPSFEQRIVEILTEKRGETDENQS